MQVRMCYKIPVSNFEILGSLKYENIISHSDTLLHLSLQI